MFGVHFLRHFRLFLPIGTGVALLALLAVAPASANEGKAFTGVKDCNTVSAPGEPDFCVITASNLKILRNARMYYTNPVVADGVLRSPITLKALDEEGSTATGRCTFHFVPVTGHCEFWSGTGELAGFHANIIVTGVIPDTNVYTLTGTYWFERDEDDD